MLARLGVTKDIAPPVSADLRELCSSVEDFSGVEDSIAMALLALDATDYVDLWYMDLEAPPDAVLVVIPGITGGSVSARSPPRPGTFIEVTP
jgi:hypothetical protein